MVFRGKTEGIVDGEGVVRDCGGRDRTRDGAEGGVVVVCCDAITGFKVDEFRNVLVPVKGVEEFITCATLGEKRPRRHRFRRVPNEEIDL